MTKNIMLVCSAGMSTSMLVTRMQHAAKRKKIYVNIFARSVSDVGTVIENEKLDALLLGPQVRFMSQQFKEKVEGSNTRVAVINMSDYGMMNGDRVLNFAMETMAEV